MTGGFEYFKNNFSTTEYVRKGLVTQPRRSRKLQYYTVRSPINELQK